MSVAKRLPQAVARLGSVIAGKYRVDGVLGDGGMGLVVRARHLELDTDVAVKIARPELAQREEVVQRMLLESRIAARIRSEHVVKVLDAGRLPSGVPYIVMEYLEGQDLSDLLQREGRLPVELAVDFVVQACDALGEAHAAGIVHRDLKPENLFLTTRSDGSAVVKVLDFGISKHLSDVPQTSGITNPKVALGSPHYMAPEQMRAWPDVDVRADVWALGAILYELLTGVSPFSAETMAAVCARVLGGEPVSPRLHDPALPEGLEQVVMRCLAKPREQRFLNVAELALALAPFGPSAAAAYAERIARVVLGKTTNSFPALSSPRQPNSPANSLTPSLAVEWSRVSSVSVLPIADSEIEVLEGDAPSRGRLQSALFVVLALVTGAAVAAVLSLVTYRPPPSSIEFDELAIERRWQPTPSGFAARGLSQPNVGAGAERAQASVAASSAPRRARSVERFAGRAGRIPRSPPAAAAAAPGASTLNAASSGRSATAAFDANGAKPPAAVFENPAEPDAWNRDTFGGRK